jgi:hypothetical protein
MTISSKHALERFANDFGITIKEYISDNHPFRSQEFTQDCQNHAPTTNTASKEQAKQFSTGLELYYFTISFTGHKKPHWIFGLMQWIMLCGSGITFRTCIQDSHQLKFLPKQLSLITHIYNEHGSSAALLCSSPYTPRLQEAAQVAKALMERYILRLLSSIQYQRCPCSSPSNWQYHSSDSYRF